MEARKAAPTMSLNKIQRNKILEADEEAMERTGCCCGLFGTPRRQKTEVKVSEETV